MAYKCKHFLSQRPRLWSSSHERGFVTECNPAPGVPLTTHCSPFSLKDPLLCLLPITTSGHLRPTQETKDTGKDRAGLIPAWPWALRIQPGRELTPRIATDIYGDTIVCKTKGSRGKLSIWFWTQRAYSVVGGRRQNTWWGQKNSNSIFINHRWKPASFLIFKEKNSNLRLALSGRG